jgi:DNA-directed RNA polymerase subunit RPC12/RpoP
MIDMYGIVVCISCGRKRIADLNSDTSLCPYCSSVSKIKELNVIYSNADQSDVRKVFENIDSPKYAEPVKEHTDHDPLSTLVYRYEHATDMQEKLMVLADGLTGIKGSFDKEDVEELFPGKGEKMLKMMISGDIIIEIGNEKYRSL